MLDAEDEPAPAKPQVQQAVGMQRNHPQGREVGLSFPGTAEIIRLAKPVSLPTQKADALHRLVRASTAYAEALNQRPLPRVGSRPSR